MLLNTIEYKIAADVCRMEAEAKIAARHGKPAPRAKWTLVSGQTQTTFFLRPDDSVSVRTIEQLSHGHFQMTVSTTRMEARALYAQLLADGYVAR